MSSRIQIAVTSKPFQLEFPETTQMRDLSKSFLNIINFNKLFLCQGRQNLFLKVSAIFWPPSLIQMIWSYLQCYRANTWYQDNKCQDRVFWILMRQYIVEMLYGKVTPRYQQGPGRGCSSPWGIIDKWASNYNRIQLSPK